ncbi:hypothetical protein B9Z19DRAFT_963439, partial [Tuber borchii]
ETFIIIASDVRTLTGKLVHHDQTPNLVLSHTIEGIFAKPGSEETAQQVGPGLYLLIRGDIVALSRHVDEPLEVETDWSEEPLT